MESFQSVFIALTIAGALTVGAFFIQTQRPAATSEQPGAEPVTASDTSASCHRRESPAIAVEFERATRDEGNEPAGFA